MLVAILAASVPLALAILGVAWRLGSLESTVKEVQQDVKDVRDDLRDTRDDVATVRDNLGGRVVGGRRWNDPRGRKGRP